MVPGVATIGEVEKLALGLPESQRALLAAHLLGSLPSVLHDEDGGIAEALRRDEELDANPSTGISLMRLILHPKVYSDIDKIMEYYERADTPGLADEFYKELRHFMAEAGERPESCSIRQRDIRRMNLQRFPYHFLFRIVGDTVRILVVRHHGRHPSVGVTRR